MAAPVVLVCGVTPELCSVQLPPAGRVIAVDSSTDMIVSHWPGRIREGDAVIAADWRLLPIRGQSVDLVLGDGSWSAIPTLNDYARMGREIAAALRAGGRGVFRAFMRPQSRESVDDVAAALERREIGNFHVLKWRLAMAVQDDASEGVSVADVWSAFHRVWPEPDELASRVGWPVAEVRTIDAYRNAATRYNFPTLTQYRAAFAEAGFTIVRMLQPTYELGERCPTFVLERA